MAHIVIDASPFPISYTVGASARTNFTVPGPFFAHSDLVVTSGVTTLILNTDYTVTGTAVDGGFQDGTVVLAVAVTNTTVTIDRLVPVTRTTDFPNSGPLDMRAVNTQFDKIVAMVQQQGAGSATAAAASAVSAAASAAVATAAADSVTAAAGVTFIVTGADSTGASEVSTDIQAVIDACEAAGGGIVIVPHGTYLINGGLSISKSVSFQGTPAQNFKGNADQGLPGDFGTYFKRTTTTNYGITVETGSNGARVGNFGFIETHAADAPGWTPTAYKACIRNISAGTTIHDINFWGCNIGIQIGDAVGPSGSGYVTVRDCYGACFTNCIDVQFAGDFIVIENCFFHGSFLVNLTNQVNYIQANSTVVAFARCDHPTIKGLKAYGFKFGIRTYDNGHGPTIRFIFSDVAFDSTRIGLEIITGCFGMITNFETIGDATPGGGGYGIQLTGNAQLFASNVSIINADESAVYSTASGAGNPEIFFDRVWVDQPNVSGVPSPAFVATGGGLIYFSSAPRITRFAGSLINAVAGFVWDNRKYTDVTSAAGGATGTLTNAPAAGNPGHWLRITIDGVAYAIPCWTV